MRTLSARCAALGILMITLASIAPAASHARAAKSFTLSGRVLHVDQKARTILVREDKSKKLYLVDVPEDASFRITFGVNMKYSQPSLSHVYKNDRISARCIRIEPDRLARLEDGRQVIAIKLAR